MHVLVSMINHCCTFSPILYGSRYLLCFLSYSECNFLCPQHEKHFPILAKCSNGVIKKRDKWVFLEVISRSVTDIKLSLCCHYWKYAQIFWKIPQFHILGFSTITCIYKLLQYFKSLFNLALKISHKQMMFINEFASFKSFTIWTLR